jgi:hypothetical protein
MKNFNNKLALKITDAVSTMWCAYIFAIIALFSLPAAIATHQLIIIVAWIAQTFLQLVLLSVIMVGQKIQADTTIIHVKKHLDDHHAKIVKLIDGNASSNL